MAEERGGRKRLTILEAALLRIDTQQIAIARAIKLVATHDPLAVSRWHSPTLHFQISPASLATARQAQTVSTTRWRPMESSLTCSRCHLRKRMSRTTYNLSAMETHPMVDSHREGVRDFPTVGSSSLSVVGQVQTR